jgi:hypothetical protein
MVDANSSAAAAGSAAAADSAAAQPAESAAAQPADSAAAPFELPIERGKLLEFTKAVHTPAAAGDEDVIPPTFLTTMRHWVTPATDGWRHFGFDPARTLHASEEYEFVGPPPRVGDVLTAQSRVEKIWERTNKSGGTLRFGTMLTEFRDPTGAVVARARLTGVETPPKRENPA